MSKFNKENNKSFIGKMKASFSGRKFKSGAYATMISVVVIVIVFIVNLIVSKMDITFDLTASSKYSLTKDTKDMAKNLKDNITIYYMVQQGNEQPEMEKIAKQYTKLSNKIKLVTKDPVLYPQFASKYVSDQITEDSFIVVDDANNRAKYIAESDMVISQTDYQTYQSTVTGTDAEGKITSAILYVTSENLPKLYVVQGHGEADIPTSFSDSMSKMNIDAKTLTTQSQASIPSDCNILYINAPTSDFTDAETKMIKDYLAAGGNAIITADYMSSKLTNFLSILDNYGIKLADGVVVESDVNMMYPNNPSILLPKIESHEITSKADDSRIPVIMPSASGLIISDTKRSTLTITPLLTTSDSAYSKVNIQSATLDKEAGDISGPFNIGLVATDTYNGVTSKVIVYSSKATFTDDTVQYGSNGELLTGTVGFLTGNTSAVSIPAKTYGDDTIHPTPVQSYAWGAITVFAIPLIILISGAVICLRRRKK